MAIYHDYSSSTNLVTDIEAINNAIQNILLTEKGSLPGKPRFGCNLNKMLFEHIDHVTIDLIEKYIMQALLEFEPRIKVQNISIKSIEEYNRVVANIDYIYNTRNEVISGTTTINLKDN